MVAPPIDLPWTTALRERFAFESPPAFRALEARGLFLWRNEEWADMLRPGDHYVWFNDMEWLQPEDLRTFEFADGHRDGFIPFAHTGGGDYWCWYPALQRGTSVPVVSCPHDCNVGDLYAPDFASSLYRHAIEFTTDDSPEQDAQLMMRCWAREFSPIWPSPWCDHVVRLAGAVTTWSEHRAWVAAEFGEECARDFGVPWMRD